MKTYTLSQALALNMLTILKEEHSKEFAHYNNIKVMNGIFHYKTSDARASELLFVIDNSDALAENSIFRIEKKRKQIDTNFGVMSVEYLELYVLDKKHKNQKNTYTVSITDFRKCNNEDVRIEMFEINGDGYKSFRVC